MCFEHIHKADFWGATRCDRERECVYQVTRRVKGLGFINPESKAKQNAQQSASAEASAVDGEALKHSCPVHIQTGAMPLWTSECFYQILPGYKQDFP